MTRENTSEGSQGETGTQQQSSPPITTAQSSIDEMVTGMIRTLEGMQRDPLLHHRLSQRGF